jgi:adenylate cyclase class 2
MSTTKQETEVKLYTPNLEPIKRALIDANAKVVAERVFERNVRYENHEQTLTPQGIVLRMRQDTRIRLTYKGPGVVLNGITSREELEVEVSDYGMMDIILARLGYHAYMAYEKYRTTYRIGNGEIFLDELPYGNFTEIEGGVAIIESIIKQLDLSSYERITHSYAGLFDIVRQNMELDMPHLTFEAFEGINVPSQALYPPEPTEEGEA